MILFKIRNGFNSSESENFLLFKRFYQSTSLFYRLKNKDKIEFKYKSFTVLQ